MSLSEIFKYSSINVKLIFLLHAFSVVYIHTIIFIKTKIIVKDIIAKVVGR